MKRLVFSILGLVLIALIAPALHGMAATTDALAIGPMSISLDGIVLDLPALAILPAINLSGVAELFRPDRIAQVITQTEAYGTPALDRFYPESRRKAWGQVLVPVSKITSITRAVPLVIRGANPISISPLQTDLKWIEPQPIKTYDAISAVEYNNAALAGSESLQQWADSQMARHIVAHRQTTEGLAAQSLTGQITWPIADRTGSIIDTFTVQFGTPGTYTVTKSWTDSGTTLAEIYVDLVNMKLQGARAGYNLSSVLVGQNVIAALLGKLTVAANDTRIVARQREDGGIQIGEFTLVAFTGEYYHPGGPSGSPAAGYVKAIGDDEILAYDPAAPWTLLRVRLDNFKMGDSPVPLGAVSELTKDGGALELFFESKPLPIPVPEATILTDVTEIASS